MISEKQFSDKPEFDGEWVRLGDVCSKGKSALRQKDLKNDGPYPVYGASGIVGFSSEYQNADAYVAVVKDGAGVGRVVACEPRSSVLGTMQALLPGEGTDRDYLLHLVRSLDLGKGFTGSTIPHIYFKDYGKTLVRALSGERQVEVASKLNGIDRLISQSERQLSALDDLVKSQFVEMFGDSRRSPKEWPRTTLGSTCEVITGNTPSTKRDDYYDHNDIQFIKPGDIGGAGQIGILATESWLSEAAREKARIAPVGAVLMTCIGIIGRVGITTSEAAFNQQINAAIPGKAIHPYYLAYYLLQKADDLRQQANQAVVPILNKTAFAGIETIIPPSLSSSSSPTSSRRSTNWDLTVVG